MSEPTTQASETPEAAPQEPGQRPRRSRVGRVLRWAAGILALVLLAAVGLIGFVLGTEPGLRATIALVEKVAPGMLVVGKVEGRVLGRLHLEALELHLATTEVEVGRFDLDWSPSAIFGGVIAVANLAASDIDVRLGPSPEEEEEPFALPSIAIPFRLDVDRVSVDRLFVRRQGAETPLLALEHAGLGASMQGSDLQVLSLDAQLQQPLLSASAKGHARLSGDYPLGLDLDWTLTLPPDAELTGGGKLSGDLQQLQILHSLRGSVDADLRAKLSRVIESPSWEGSLEVHKVDLPAFRPDMPAVETHAELRSSGSLEEATVAGSLDAKAPDLPDFGHLAAVLDVLWKDRQLTIRRLDMTEQVSDARFDAHGQLDLGAAPGRFAIEGKWANLRWPLSGELIARSLEGKLDASGSFEDFGYGLEALAEGPSIPSSRILLKGKGTAERTDLETLRLDTLGGAVTGEGRLAWLPELGWDLRLTGKDLDPGTFLEGLDDRVLFNLETKGALEHFRYDMVASTSGPGLPPASLTLVGGGDLARTELETLRLDILDGRIEGQGAVDLTPTIGWEGAVSLSGINPESYVPEWPGRIDGRLTSRGSLEASGLSLEAVIEQLSGTLRGYPIAARGRVAVQDGSTRLDGLTAESGPSKLRVDGILAEQLALDFSLSSPSLASLLPEAEGSLSVSGRAQGTLEAPEVTLELRAQDAAFAGNGVSSLTGTADIGLGSNGRFEVRLDGKGLTAGGMTWEQLAVRGDGSLPSHRVTLDLTGQQLSTQVALEGGALQGGGYKGELTRLDLRSPLAGSWGLQKGAPFSLEPPRIAAGPLCLRHPRGSGGCLTFEQPQAEQWRASVDLDKLDFALLEELLPEKLTAEGLARLKGSFRAEAGVLIGEAIAEVPKGVVSVELGKGQRQKLDFSTARLAVDANRGGLSAKLGVPLEGIGDVRADLALPGWRLADPARPGQPLRGGLKAKVEDFSPIANMAPQLTSLRGAVDADLTLGGTIAQPGVKGRAQLTGVGFEVPLIALRVSDLNLAATAPSMDSLTIQGGALVGGGRLDITGDGRMASDGFKARASIKGDRLKVADTKEYFAVVSPAIDIEAGAGGADVRGEIRIPEARIRPKSVPAGTVSPSPDVTLEEKESAPPYPVAIDLAVVMGKDVTIDAFGVRGRLDGSLAILQTPGKDMLGDGQLQITDGEYRLSGGFGIAAELGPPLTITQGRLIYAKSPIDNPGLLLQAERDGGDTTAGVRVLGTLRSPKLAFFSESDPGMTQAEITKYLVTGIPPAGNDRTEDAGLAVGTYVAPKIYMEYESGLGDEANKVKLRYDLSRHIELQTETGDSQGADIFFKFEN